MVFSFMNERDCTNALEEICGFCDVILRRVAEYGITQDSIGQNSDHADLVLMPLCQIGESVQAYRNQLEERFPDEPWHKMAGLRNVIVHGYAKVDPSIVFATVQSDIPSLRDFCARQLQE